MEQVQVEERIEALPETLYAMVSDVTRMGSWSPETTSCRWLAGATGPSVGARFKGTNRHGWRRWQTVCTVTSADPGQSFGFDVRFGSFPISHWDYRFLPDGGATTVVETWTDRRPGWMIKASPTVMGVADRAGHNRDGMTATLARLRQAAETTPPPA